MPWRSASGYLGLTMIFWSPAEKAFYSCTDARPEVLRGFDPIARYKAPGPWGGLGAPEQATGKMVTLTGALMNSAGRLSAAEGVSRLGESGPFKHPGCPTCSTPWAPGRRSLNAGGSPGAACSPSPSR